MRWLFFCGLFALALGSLDGPSESVPNDQPMPDVAAAQEDAEEANVTADAVQETTMFDETGGLAENVSEIATVAVTTASTTVKIISTTPMQMVPTSGNIDPALHRDQPAQPSDTIATESSEDVQNPEIASSSLRHLFISFPALVAFLLF
ncbi:unnamed protein product, partial [Mesorhabditis spiculigera]